MYDLTGIYWIKNEARYIPEYIEFHLMQGFDHFIFYDNLSTDNLEETISPYIEADIIEIKHYPDFHIDVKNYWVMEHEIVYQTGRSRWIHFHATDERLFSPEGRNVVSVLDEIVKDDSLAKGVAVPWTIINSSGWIERPDGLVIENYTMSQNDRMNHIKTIIKPECAVSPNAGPHNFSYNIFGFHTVSERGTPINSHFDTEKSDKMLKLFHYLSYSKSEFEERMGKGVLDVGSQAENAPRWDTDFQWELAHNPENAIGPDESLLKYVEPVRAAILSRYAGREHLLERINH